MKSIILCMIVFLNLLAQSADDKRVYMMDYVKILNDNVKETLFYYENNWKVLRDNAMKQGIIQSYSLLFNPDSEVDFDLILVTVFKNKEDYDKSEERFKPLLEAKGGRTLLNDKQPKEFRKILYNIAPHDYFK